MKKITFKSFPINSIIDNEKISFEEISLAKQAITFSFFNSLLFVLAFFLLGIGSIWGQTTKSSTTTLDAKTSSASQPVVRKAVKALESPNQSDYQKELWKKEPFGGQDGSRELFDKRDAFSKHFQNDNGSITAHIASGPIHYQENGQWKTIYHTIEPSANGGFQNIYNSFKTYYPATANGEIVTVLPDGSEMRDMQGMRMYYESNGQEVGAMNIASTLGSVDFNKLTYPAVYGSQIDLRLTQNSTMRKMDYLLQSAAALSGAPQNAEFLVFEEKVVLPQGVIARLIENKIILTNAKGNVIAEYTNPIIYDEQPADTEDESYVHRSEAKYQIEQNGNVLTIKTKVEMTWLLDGNRNFPIVVDPTTNYVVDGSAYSCAYSVERPDNNTCASVVDATAQFFVGRDANETGNAGSIRWVNSYNRFGISSLPPGSTVSSATVYFTMHNITATTGLGTMALYKMNYNQTTTSCRNFYANITGTAYSSAFSGVTISNNVGAHSLQLNATGVADLQAKVGTSWFALAYRPTGTYYASRWRQMRGRNEIAKPYIAITYTNPACVAPTITANATSICQGQDVTFTGSTEPVYTFGSERYGYYWLISSDNGATWYYINNPNNFPGTLGADSYNSDQSTSLSVNFPDAGTYLISRDHYDICASYQESNLITITVSPTSVAGTTSSNQTICSGQIPAALTLTGNTGAIQWQSSADNNTFSNIGSATTSTLTLSSLSSTTYYRAVVTSGACSSVNSNVVTITVNQLSVAPASISGTTTICNSSSTTLTATGGTLGTGANYEWGTGSTVGTNPIAGQTGASITVSPTSTTAYWVRIVNTTSPCTATTSGVTATVTVNQPSVAPTSISISTTTICSGSSTTLTAAGGTLGTGASYEWGTGSTVGTNPISGSTASITVSPTSTTTYWVRIINTTSPCTATTSGVTATVTVNQPSVAPTSISGTTTICNSSSTTLTAIGGTLGTGANYEWGTGSTVGTNPIAGQTGASITVSPTSTTTYWVRIINTTSPCTTTTSGVTATVTVNQPSVAPTSISGTTTICNSSSTVLTAAGGTLGTGANYEWGTGAVVGTNPIAGQTGASITVSPTSTTTYWVRIINTTSPCTTTTSGVTATVTVNQPSVAPTSISGTTTICNSSSTTLTAIGGTLGTGANYEWGTGSTVGTNPIAGQTGASITVSPTSTTTYWVRIINTTSPCTATTGGVTVNVTVNPSLPASVRVVSNDADNIVCTGTSVTFTATPTNGGTTPTYQWFVGTTPVGTNSDTYTSTTLANNDVVTVQMTSNATPCLTGSPATSTGITMTVNPIPTTANAGPDQQVCSTNTITLAGNTATSGTGAWSIISGTGGTVTTPSSATSTFTGTAGTTYTLRWTISSGVCTTSTDDVVITIFSPLDFVNLQFPGTATICQGNSLTAYGQVYEAGVTTLGVQGSGITVEFGYNTTNNDPLTWTNWFGATYNASSVNNNNDEYQYTFTPSASGTYYYTFRYKQGACDWQYGGYTSGGGGTWGGSNVSGVLTVNSNAAHTISLSSGSATSAVCQNTALGTNIVYAIGGGATDAGVTGLPSGMSGSFSSGNYTISGTPTTSGTFNYTVTTTGNGCASAVTASGTITVSSALDYVNLQFPGSATICQGGSFTAYGQVYEFGVTTVGVQGSGITVEFGYNTTNNDPSTWTSWFGASYNASSVNNNNDEYQYTFTPPSTGTYYYTFRYKQGSCDWQYGGYSSGGGGTWGGSNVNGVLTVNPNATATISGNSGAICNNKTATFTLSGTSGAIVTYTINSGSNQTITLTDGTATVSIPNATANQTLNLVSVSLGSCTASLSGSSTVIVGEVATWNGTSWVGTPGANKGIVFNGNFSSTNNIEGCSCAITSGNIVINSNHTVKLLDAITVNGGSITFENNSSLIQINDVANTGNITYNRSSATGTVLNTDYVYWSAPVSNQYVPSTGLNYFWNNAAGTSGNWVSASGQELTAGKGVIMRGIASRNFTGVPFNGEITVEVFRRNLPDYNDNWNLIGNPYPSAISADEFLLDNDNSAIEGSIAIWTHGSAISNGNSSPFYGSFAYNYNPNDYIIYNTFADQSGPSSFAGNIAAGQAFFVKYDNEDNAAPVAANSTVKFKNSMRTDISGNSYGNSQFYRSSQSVQNIEKHRIWLDFISGTSTATSRTVVGFADLATSGKDRLFDASTTVTASNATMYSLIGTNKMSIQAKGLPFTDQETIPMGYNAPQTGNYTVAIHAVDGLFGTQNIYLEDTQLNVIHDIKLAPYTFAATQGENNNRFVLRFTNSNLGNDDFEMDNAVVIYTNANINIKSVSENIKSVQIFDLLGRNIATFNTINNTQFMSNNMMPSKLPLLVKVTLENGLTKTYKIIY